MARKAGEEIANYFGGQKKFGEWSEEWDNNAKQQQVYASGAFDANSNFADIFAGLKEDGSSRVDDQEGWKELVFDSPAKTADEYREKVQNWQAAGFDVRGIDFDPENFKNSNIAVRVGKPRQSTEPSAPEKQEIVEDVIGQPNQSITAPITGITGKLNPVMNVNQANPVKVTGDNNETIVDNSINQGTYDFSNNSQYFGRNSFISSLAGQGGVINDYESTPISIARDGKVSIGKRPTAGILNINKNSVTGGNINIGFS